jgi:hypothetical protein
VSGVGEVDLQQLLMQKQEQLLAELNATDVFRHPVAKGDVGELNWEGALNSRNGGKGFLPGRYAVSSAFIIDANGQTSEQIDLVVHDAHFCPLFFEAGGHCFIPAESVYAVFEVKPELSRENILYAGGKAASVRALRRTSVPIVHAGGTFAPREPFQILAGLLAKKSGWSPPFGESLNDALTELEPWARLDFGATATDGAFEVSYETGRPELLASDADAGLMFFLSHLYTRLQQLGTVTAIDLAAYARPLEAD